MCSRIDMDEAIRSLAPRFVPIRRLGGGVQGSVFAVQDRKLNLDVALKLTVVHDGQEVVRGFGNVRERFRREFEILVDLNQRDLIVRPFDLGETRLCGLNAAGDLCPSPNATLLWYSMELCGTSLKRALPRLEPGQVPVMSLPDRVAIALQVLEAISILHVHGLAHRDIKLDNVFIPRRPRPESRIRLGDLGIARGVRRGGDHTRRLTEMDTQLGTLHYMGPECFQARGAESVDLLLSDQYAAGMVAFEILSHGALPFDFGDDSEIAIFRAKAHAEPLPLVFPETGRAVDRVAAVLHRMMAREPASRFMPPSGSAAAMQQAIAALRNALKLSRVPVPD